MVIALQKYIYVHYTFKYKQENNTCKMYVLQIELKAIINLCIFPQCFLKKRFLYYIYGKSLSVYFNIKQVLHNSNTNMYNNDLIHGHVCGSQLLFFFVIYLILV